MAGFCMTCKNIESMKLQCNITLKNVNLERAIITQNEISIVAFNAKQYLFSSENSEQFVCNILQLV